MPQYSNTQTTPSGIVINADYNTEASTITFTATAQNGTVVTATQQTIPSASAAISSDTTNTLYAGLNAAGANLGTPSGFNGTLKSTQTAVKAQASQAAQAATVTDKPVADAPAPPTSTNNTADPAVAPATNTTPVVESPSPPAQVSTFQDPAQAQQAAIINADNAAPAQVSTFQDPAQRQQAADQVAIDQAKTTNNIQDPAQRAQAREIVENYQAPAVDQTDAETARLARQNNAIQNSTAVVDTNQDAAETARLKRAEDAAAKAEADANLNAAETERINNTNSGTTGAKLDTQSKATQQDAVNFQAKADWRVRLSLSPGAKSAGYLYWASPAGILEPLQATDGVIFPYTPAISVAYNASYDPTELTHSNYKFFTYRGSAVDSVTIGCDFTAQDTFEANYLLAVIHFFKSITKMFYGQDQNPKNGTPPPLCYLSGLGAFQFDAHPLAITSFTYTLPTDVDYIQAGSNSTPPGVNQQNGASGKPGENAMAQAAAARLTSSGLNPGALLAPANFQNTNTGSKDATYVPTKISISIQAVPIVTRNDISNTFSLKDYATGALLRGSKRAGGGIW